MDIEVVILIYSIIGVITLISLITGIINWFSLSRTNSIINDLQSEIEKKSYEFDTRKRESNAAIPQTAQQDTYLQSPVDANLSLPPLSNEKEPHIEIVRNIRGSFDNQSLSQLHQEMVSLDNHSSTSQPLPVSKPNPPSGFSSTSQKDISNPDNRPDNHILPEYENDNSAAYNQNKSIVEDSMNQSLPPQQHPPLKQPQKITIALYSSKSKDADFKALWQNIREALDRSQNIHITIDFKNVLFLYDKELEYLKKIYHIVTVQQSEMEFINCSRELITALSKDVELSQLIDKPSNAMSG